MSIINCSGCGQKFDGDEFGESPAFDMHDCPRTLKPHVGESWEDYKMRCDKHDDKGGSA